MAFIRSAEYFAYKIKNIEEAIKGTEDNIKNLTEQRQIDAHKAQIRCYIESLAKTKTEYLNWRNKQQNRDRGAIYRGY